MNNILLKRLPIACVGILMACTIHAADRPNILFVMSDDHTSQAIGVYGGRLAPLNPTPTIDSIAKGHSSDVIADSALEWFKNRRDPNQPFFLKLHFKAPHDMFQYAPRYETYLADVEIPEPENMRDRKNHGSIAIRGHNDELVPFIGTSIGRRNPRRNYTKSGLRLGNCMTCTVIRPKTTTSTTIRNTLPLSQH